jgi:hypothetical protein
LLAATGVTNKSLRALMTGLLAAPYSPGQMTYGLRRLRLAGLVRRIEHTNRYVLTPDGTRFAVFYTKLHNRLLRPLMAADQPQAPPDLRQALRAIDQHVDHYITRARLCKTALKLDTNVQNLATKETYGWSTRRRQRRSALLTKGSARGRSGCVDGTGRSSAARVVGAARAR